eukprot:jgi/Botrbrau1/23085/Bobra.0243s0024.2
MSQMFLPDTHVFTPGLLRGLVKHEVSIPNYMRAVNPRIERRTVVASSTLDNTASTTADKGQNDFAGTFFIRRASIEDAQLAASLVTEAFAAADELQLSRMPQFFLNFSRMSNASIQSELSEQLVLLLQHKEKATKMMRDIRDYRRKVALIDELAGRRLPQVAPTEERMESRLICNRRVACLLAIDRPTGQAVGTATVSMLRPEAWLPPPFPTQKPMRCYLSNMAVDPCFRKRGIARALLRRFETLVRRWGQDSLWLHVDRNNEAANEAVQIVRIHVGEEGAPLLARRASVATGRRSSLADPSSSVSPGTAAPAPPQVTGGSHTGTRRGFFVWDAASE